MFWFHNLQGNFLLTYAYDLQLKAFAVAVPEKPLLLYKFPQTIWVAPNFSARLRTLYLARLCQLRFFP